MKEERFFWRRICSVFCARRSEEHFRSALFSIPGHADRYGASALACKKKKRSAWHGGAKPREWSFCMSPFPTCFNFDAICCEESVLCAAIAFAQKKRFGMAENRQAKRDSADSLRFCGVFVCMSLCTQKQTEQFFCCAKKKKRFASGNAAENRERASMAEW